MRMKKSGKAVGPDDICGGLGPEQQLCVHSHGGKIAAEDGTFLS